MNVLEFIVLVSTGVVVLAVGVDVGQQVWVEKHAERKAQWAKLREAESLLYASIAKRFEERAKPLTTVIELKVVALPPKPVGGRHRLSVA